MTAVSEQDISRFPAVRDQHDLPSMDNSSYFVVHDLDRRLLIASRTGTVYRRRDGGEWPGDGFKVLRSHGGELSVESASRVIGDGRKIHA